MFHIDPKTKRSWISASASAVNVSFFYDSTRSLYRIISVEGTKVSYTTFFLQYKGIEYLDSISNKLSVCGRDGEMCHYEGMKKRVKKFLYTRVILVMIFMSHLETIFVSNIILSLFHSILCV